MSAAATQNICIDDRSPGDCLAHGFRLSFELRRRRFQLIDRHGEYYLTSCASCSAGRERKRKNGKYTSTAGHTTLSGVVTVETQPLALVSTEGLKVLCALALQSAQLSADRYRGCCCLLLLLPFVAPIETSQANFNERPGLQAGGSRLNLLLLTSRFYSACVCVCSVSVGGFDREKIKWVVA